jgi:hypothetical protein
MIFYKAKPWILLYQTIYSKRGEGNLLDNPGNGYSIFFFVSFWVTLKVAYNCDLGVNI